MTETIGFNPEADKVDKVQVIKNRLVDANFLKPDDKQKDKLSNKLSAIFSDNLGHGFGSVADMELAIQDDSKTEVQKKIAREDRKILGEAVVLAVRDIRDKKLVSDEDLFLGSKHMENMLPKELKGLGREVTKQFISNEDIDKQLNLLEVTRQNVDLGNPSSVETLAQKIGVRIEKLKNEDYEDENSIGEQDAVLTVLNGEKRKYNNTGGSQNKDVLNVKSVDNVDDEATGVILSQMDKDTGEYRSRSWEISPEYAAMGMKFMDDIRWQTYTPPEWFKHLKPRGKETAEQLQTRIEYMMMVNEGANWLSKVGPDLDKIRENPLYKSFDGEKFTKLFNEDFKLVMSKLLNDLCEPYTDQNSKTCMRYKEIFYLKDNKGEWERNKEGKRIIGDWKKDKGAFDIDDNVNEKLVNIRDYKEEMANFLAERRESFEKDKDGNFVMKDGERVPKSDYMDQMNAYTAWNLFYMFGDSSLADRMRVLPTYGGIINDGVRTLNTEKKALAKWKVEKGGVASSDTVFGAEWFSSFGPYIQKVMKVEEDLGYDVPVKEANGEQEIDEYGRKKYKRVSRPIDGDKTIREKILDGTLPILANKTCYGFFDFVSGQRDLLKINGEKFDKKEGETLGTLLREYAKFDNGKLISKNENKDFTFTKKQVDFLNWYRDQQEAAALVLNCVTGKEDVKDVEKFVRKLRTAFGMVNEIEINKERTFTYTTRPDLWANIILGSFGIDMSRLSSDHIRLKTQPYKDDEGEIVEPAYNLFVESFLTDTMGLSNSDVNLTEVMRYLGVDLKNGENPKSIGASLRNNREWMAEKRRTDSLLKKQNKTFDYGNKGIKSAGGSDYENFKKLKEINFEFSKIIRNFKSYDAEMIYRDLARAIKSGEVEIATKLLTKFEEANQ